MNRLIVVLLLLGIVPVFSAAAETYTCRDEQGRLYVGDNLQALPEACRAKVRKLSEQDTGNLNFVPEAAGSAKPNKDFSRAVSEEQDRLTQRQSREGELKKRSQAMAAEYQQAEKQKWAARRDLTSRSNALYDKAVQKQDQLRSEKKTILKELGQERLSTDVENEIRKNLEQVGDR